MEQVDEVVTALLADRFSVMEWIRFVRVDESSGGGICHAGMKSSIPFGARRVSKDNRMVWVLESFGRSEMGQMYNADTRNEINGLRQKQ